MAASNNRSEERLERAAQRERLRSVPRTKLGITAGILAIVVAPLAVLFTMGSLGAIQTTYGVVAMDSSPFLLTYIIGGGIVLGGIGLLLPKTWGWWLTLVAAVLGPLDLLRIYRGLYASLNFDHPDVGKVIRKLAFFAGVPTTLFVAVLVLLLVRRMRETYRVSAPRD